MNFRKKDLIWTTIGEEEKEKEWEIIDTECHKNIKRKFRTSEAKCVSLEKDKLICSRSYKHNYAKISIVLFSPQRILGVLYLHN